MEKQHVKKDTPTKIAFAEKPGVFEKVLEERTKGGKEDLIRATYRLVHDATKVDIDKLFLPQSGHCVKDVLDFVLNALEDCTSIDPDSAIANSYKKNALVVEIENIGDSYSVRCIQEDVSGHANEVLLAA